MNYFQLNPGVMLMLVTIALAAFELIAIIVFGLVFCEYAKSKCRNLRSVRIFKEGEYDSQLAKDHKDSIYWRIPRNFRFVIVHYQENSEQVISEAYYTFWGDITKYISSNEKSIEYSFQSYVSWFLVSLAVMSFFLFFLQEYLVSPMQERAIFVGLSIFFSLFIMAPIKAYGFDYRTYL